MKIEIIDKIYPGDFNFSGDIDIMLSIENYIEVVEKRLKIALRKAYPNAQIIIKTDIVDFPHSQGSRIYINEDVDETYEEEIRRLESTIANQVYNEMESWLVEKEDDND